MHKNPETISVNETYMNSPDTTFTGGEIVYAEVKNIDSSIREEDYQNINNPTSFAN